MSRKVMLMAFAMILLCVSCATVQPPPNVRMVDGLHRLIHVTDVHYTKNESGFNTVQINLASYSRREIWLEWKVQWYDASGREIDSLTSTWQKTAIIPKDFTQLKNTAPSTNAETMLCYIRKLKR